MSNIIIADFTDGTETTTEKRYQYDYGQRLKITGATLPDPYEVHFSNRLTGGAIVMLGDSEGVDIPNELMATGLEVYAWTFIHEGEGSGQTILKATIPIIKRAMPTEEQPTPEQESLITRAIELLEDGLATVDEAVAQSAANVAYYPRIINNNWHTYNASTESWQDTGVDAHGNGIASVSVDPTTYTMTITFDNGTTYVTDSLRGPEGPQGPQGQKGNKGDKGDTGATGAQGPQGERGPVAAFSIGTTSTLPAGSSATATITGTDAAPVLNLGIPKGDKGDKGDTGAVTTETITNWNTSYDSTKPVRFLFGNNASNSPASGAQIVGIEESTSSSNRIQMAMRAGSGTDDTLWIRHAPNGTWGAWVEVGAQPTTATVATGINGISAVKCGKVVTIYFNNFTFAANTPATSAAYTLPTALVPAIDIDLRGSHNTQRFFIRAATNTTPGGYIQPAADLTAATAIRGSFTYLTN